MRPFGRESGPNDELARQYEQLAQRYEAGLTDIADSHSHFTQQVADRHTHDIKEVLTQAPDMRTLAGVLDGTAKLMGNVNEGTASTVEALFADAQQEFVKLIPDADQPLWARIQTLTGRYQANSDTIQDLLGSASSVSARLAMEAALDRHTWARIQTLISRYPLNSDPIQNLLSSTFGPLVHIAMERVLSLQQPAASDSQERPRAKTEQESFSEQGFNEEQGDQYWEHFSGIFSEMFKNAGGTYGSRTGASGQRQQAPPPRQKPNNEKAQEVARQVREAKNIIEKAILNDGQAKWLRSIDIIHVRRVVSTVRTLRERAASDGGSITDRQIYMIYRRKVEVGEVSETLQTSMRIIDAMMGGPSGKLPF